MPSRKVCIGVLPWQYRPWLVRSQMIYEFLCEHLGKEKAKFDNAFDLPLLIVAMDSRLQFDLLKTTVVTDSEAEEESEYV